MGWWFALWVACTCSWPGHGPEEPSTQEAAVATLPAPEPYALTDVLVPGFPEFRTAGAPSLQLHLLEPRSQLPRVQQPKAVAAVSDRFVLVHEELPNRRNSPRELKVLRAELPFPVQADDQLFRPTDMEVRIKGEAIPFARQPAPQAKRSTWRIKGKYLILSHPTVPPPGSVEVLYPGVRDQLDRHDPARAGLSDVDFVHTEITLGHGTRSGLLLVAPTVLEWDVALPAGSVTFEAWAAMEPAPLRQPMSDGADLVLTVIDGGVPTEIARKRIPGVARDFDRWRADLSRWAGRPVTVRLAAEPGDSTAFDWVFAGSPTIWAPPRGETRRVVVIGLDTTRPDHLSFNGYRRPTTPEIDAFARSAVVFGQTWAPAPRTRPSFRSATTGRQPLEAVGATNVGEVFRRHGFATAGFVANPHLQPHFDFSRGFDTWSFDGQANARQQVDRALDWLGDALQRDTYLFLHLMDPHMIYDAPGDFRDRFVEDPDPALPARVRRSEVLARMKQGTLTDRQKQQLEALHDGELAYTSAELGRLFDALDRMPGRTLVVVHSDHGEEFWEHGGFEHNHTLYDELTRALLAFRPRGGLPEGRSVDVPATLADIAPTLFDLFGFTDVPPMDGRSLVPLMAGVSGWAERPIPLGHLQYDHERWGVVWAGHKYVLHTGSGREELYDLTADPAESRDLSEERALEPFREQLARAHHIPVGPGWRVRVQLESTEPMEIDLPAAAIGAGVVDPESVVERRANVEWGERPRRTEIDVGEVTLSADRRTVRFTPGPDPHGGVLFVLFAEAHDPRTATVRQGARALTATEGALGPRFEAESGALVIDPGTVVVPPMTEAERMGIVARPAPQDDLMSQLCELGYVEEGCPDGEN